MSTAILEQLKNLSFLSVGPFTVVGSFAFMGPFNSMVSFASCGPFSSIQGVSLSHIQPFHLREALNCGGSGVIYADCATD